MNPALRVIKAVGIVFSSIFLLAFLMLLVYAISMKDIVQNGFMVSITKESLKEVVPEENKKDVDEIINKVASYPETNEIIESILNDYANYSTTRDVSDKTIDLIIQFCKDHIDDYKKLTGEDVDISDIDTPESREELRKSINEGIQEVRGNDDSEKVDEVVTLYTNITSTKCWKGLAAIVVGLICLIVLLSWSYFKWLQPVGIVSIIAAIFTFISYSGFSLISKLISDNTDMKISFAPNTLLYASIIEIVVGISFLVVFSLLNKRDRENQSVGQITTV